MTPLLNTNSAIDAAQIPLEHDPAPAEDVVAGSPEIGEQTLVTVADVEIGIWELTPGGVTDTETDETFVILSGEATVEILDTGDVLSLSPGVVGRLAAGTRTRWTVTETLRKVYIVRAE